MCNAEFRTLKKLLLDSEGAVSVVAVGFGSSQTVRELNKQKEKHNYPGVFVEGSEGMAQLFGVRTQSTKFGISADGVIVFKKGYGIATDTEWRTRLRALADS